MDDFLSNVRAQFLSMTPIRNFVWMDSCRSTENMLHSSESQLSILQMTVNTDICKKYPPSLKYQQMFLKSLIQKCEATECEVTDELYETYTALLSKPQPELQDDCYRTYTLPGERCTVTLKESVSMISQGTTGLNTWPAASFLTEWGVENKDVFCGRMVLELGSGMGLTGLAVCRVCRPAGYVFSDCHASVLRALRENVGINVLDFDSEEISKNTSVGESGASTQEGDKGPVIAVECIDWETVDKTDVERWNAGIILAADVVYDTRIIEPLVHLLHLLLQCQGDGRGRPVAFVASTVRNQATYGTFLEVLEKHKILVEKLPGPKQQTLYYDRSCSIQLLQLRTEMT